jgi:DNA-directed RNA polymerase specialized sigma24 family protein
VSSLNQAVAIRTNTWHRHEMKTETAKDVLTQPYRVFYERSDELFVPALLLTGSIERAEDCFRRAIDLAVAHASVSDAFMYSVARRCVIKAAIESIAEEVRVCAEMESKWQGEDKQTSASTLEEVLSGSEASTMEILLRLNPLRRAALILRLFERYHRTDMALLLDVPRSVVDLACKRGLVEYVQKRHV